jgi:hypothetical protein
MYEKVIDDIKTKNKRKNKSTLKKISLRTNCKKYIFYFFLLSLNKNILSSLLTLTCKWMKILIFSNFLKN